jgi:hypothetical protein
MKTRHYDHTLRLMIALVAATVSLPLLSGCRSSHTVQPTQTASVGQQLQDLDKSYKDGLITEKEYNRLRKALINKND